MHIDCHGFFTLAAGNLSVVARQLKRFVSVDDGKLHLPPGWLLLEDSIELLIRDRRVEPRPTFRDSGQDVLRDNLAAGRETSARSCRIEVRRLGRQEDDLAPDRTTQDAGDPLLWISSASAVMHRRW